MSWGRVFRVALAAISLNTLAIIAVLGSPRVSQEALGADVASTGIASAVAGNQTASPGQFVNISGTGWTPVGGVATMQICGQNARNLTADCDETNTYGAAIRTGGTFSGALTVRMPKTPCPCVFFVTSIFGQSVKIPLQIVGAPFALVPQTSGAMSPNLSATINTPRSVSSWFGGPKPVTVNLHLTNRSNAALPAPVVTVNVGKGSHPTWLAAGLTMRNVPAGASRTVSIPISIPAITFGHYTVRVDVDANSETLSTSAQTTSWPWGLLILLLVVLELTFLAVTAMIRRARRRRGAELGLAPDPRADPSIATPAIGTKITV
jgi:hypothetical protein